MHSCVIFCGTLPEKPFSDAENGWKATRFPGVRCFPSRKAAGNRVGFR